MYMRAIIVFLSIFLASTCFAKSNIPNYIKDINKCNLVTLNMHSNYENVFHTCVFNAVYKNKKYKKDLDNIKEAEEILFIERNVLDAFKKATVLSATSIREQSKIVLALEKDLNQIKLDFYLKFLQDNEYKDFLVKAKTVMN